MVGQLLSHKSYLPKTMLFLLASVPLLMLLVRIFADQLGPDPGQVIVRSLGVATLQLLLATLAMTPLRKLTGWAGWVANRRMFGLYAFFYACIHVLAYLHFVAGWQDLWADALKRPYISAGLIAFMGLLPLAITSTRGMMRRMGRRWTRLHQMVYPILVIAWVHFAWQARSDLTSIIFYAILVVFLLGLRIYWRGGWRKFARS